MRTHLRRQEGHERLPNCRLGPQLFREVLAKKEENTGSDLLDPHFGHLIRFRSRSEMDMVSVYFFRHPPQRKS